ncbi:hypothetical protein HPC49_23480 [Pyxidicoccus fallax]|uniref:Uncharacterized protein n=1 Tax=Pyxidicoccus fallax TaxID=394095 RepID=A0A848LXH7_9BACT|nr:hypothetical protein [Pyxidicoccus fallax]NMO22765.1 hypothetical protein [Pyxidicoccus fallax]NPC81177.1 hypothetical protein [Pyxidicoccus fallax]
MKRIGLPSKLPFSTRSPDSGSAKPSPPPKPPTSTKPPLSTKPTTQSSPWNGESKMEAPKPPPKPPALSGKPKPPPVPPKPPELSTKPQGPSGTQAPTQKPSTSQSTSAPTVEDFKPPSKPMKNGNRPVIGTHVYNPPKQDIVGSRFDHINPSQQHISPQIVQSKLDDWGKNGLTQPPRVPVYLAPNTQKLTIAGDGHHTFAAAMKGGHPMELLLVKMPGAGLPAMHTNWTKCTYADFGKGSAWVD